MVQVAFLAQCQRKVSPRSRRATLGAEIRVAPRASIAFRVWCKANGVVGSTLYAGAKRLNDLGRPRARRCYGDGNHKPSPGSWSVLTVSDIVRQRARSGMHVVGINGGEDRMERAVPAIVEAALQERAKAALTEHKRYPDRPYLLSQRYP